ncbi:MAG: flagellar motor switch protein FliN [Chitinivibrionales bacterium]|nr:flagellar motor switch protein FliN [Chitinivibrionales bacterium]MBD3394026.1 flagellar motor switch protein FliN [Chitinivibrionales bacterium]
MSDMLSQDQLDDLLASGDEDVSAQSIEGEDVEEGGNVKNYDALANAFSFFNEKAGGVIANVLNREASLAAASCAAIDPETLKNSVASPALAVTIPFESGLEGSMYVLVPAKNVAVLADLMLMGDGTAEYNEDHKDALGELFNQIVGAYTTALGEQIGGAVSAGALKVEEFDFDSPSFALENADMALLTLSIAEHEDGTLGVVVPDALSEALMNNFKEGQGGGGGGDSSDEGGVGLSGAELDDLSQVASGFSDSQPGGGFTEAQLGDSGLAGGSKENVEMLLDVELDVSIELGRTDLSIKRILELSPGSVIELERMAGEPVDLMVNNKVVAKGEVVVVDENFGIRIVSLVSPEERVKSLR